MAGSGRTPLSFGRIYSMGSKALFVYRFRQQSLRTQIKSMFLASAAKLLDLDSSSAQKIYGIILAPGGGLSVATALLPTHPMHPERSN
ncbi:hypothetical protein GGI09_007595, partial [Coemansia sp. S100]